MTFDEYQKQALTTNLSKEDEFLELIQQVLGLADEAGEVQSIFKKWIRDQDADPAKLDRDNVKKELGDVLWYIAVIAHDLNIPLSDIAEYNIQKLASRKARNTLSGSGDDR
jgi:NTP pyrophosphatase (non-canonical NTP hydrolase)